MAELFDAVLEFLEINQTSPNLENLIHLFDSYLHKVPWENVSRLLKYRNHNLKECPRFPEEFWNGAIEFGTGGTCFDSNGAFFRLLKHIGYEGYLTINDVLGEPAGMHGALVIVQDGYKWLVDVGYPLHSMFSIDPHKKTSHQSVSYSIQSEPWGMDRYLIKKIGHNGEEKCFTLIDKPVSHGLYRQGDLQTYRLGIFLDKIIISKIINSQLYSFDSNKGLAKLTQKGAIVISLSPNVVADISTIFAINREIVQETFKSLSYAN